MEQQSQKPSTRAVPVLTEVVDRTEPDELPVIEPGAEPSAEQVRLAELQTELAAKTFELTDGLLRAALTEMEATLFQQTSSRLRKELPDLIDQILRDHLGLQED